MVKLIEWDRCREGAGTFVAHANRELAVFRFCDPDRAVVIDNACPHAGGNLAGGTVEGRCVICPWHHWEFDLDRGVCTHSDKARLTCYPCEVRDGFVWVRLPK